MAEVEARLRGVVRGFVWNLYEHVKLRRAGDPLASEYVPRDRKRVVSPTSADETNFYYSMLRVRKSTGLTASECELLALTPEVLGPAHVGDVEPHDGKWRWTFRAAGVDRHSGPFDTRSAARDDLRHLQTALYPAWIDHSVRAAHLEKLLSQREQEEKVLAILQRPSMAFMRGADGHAGMLGQRLDLRPDARVPSQRLDLRVGARAQGFENLGNTCYINAVTQCLLHCKPFRDDIAALHAGSSFLGDRLKALSEAYLSQAATESDMRLPLRAWVAQVLDQTAFPGGSQQNAAECLMHIFLGIDGGGMQRRVCGANAAAEVEGMILCELADVAQISRAAPPVAMSSMLVASLTVSKRSPRRPPPSSCASRTLTSWTAHSSQLMLAPVGPAERSS